MRSILKNIVFYSFGLFVVSQVLTGVKVSGGFWTYILGGIVLTLLFFTVKPVLSVITLPLNVITLGTFSFLVNVIIFYLLTIFVTNISVSAFTFDGFVFAGFVIPKIPLNTFFTFIVASILLSLIVGGLKWLVDR